MKQTILKAQFHVVSIFNASTIFVCLSVNVLIVDSKREWTAPKRQCGGGGGDYWKESKGRMFSVSVNLDSRAHKHFVLMMLKRVEGTRQKYNSWPPDPDPFPSCLPSRHSYF